MKSDVAKTVWALLGKREISSVYQLTKESGIPRMTANAVVNPGVYDRNYGIDSIFKLAEFLDVPAWVLFHPLGIGIAERGASELVDIVDAIAQLDDAGIETMRKLAEFELSRQAQVRQ